MAWIGSATLTRSTFCVGSMTWSRFPARIPGPPTSRARSLSTATTTGTGKRLDLRGGSVRARHLKASEDLLGQAKDDSGDEPAWIDFYHHARLSADAAEVFRDLKNPKAALGWNQQATAMPTGVFTRSVGMRLAIVGTAHLQARDLDHGLELGNRSVDILARVQSTRAKDCVREFNTALAPWRREPAVCEFVQRTRKELGVAA